MAVKFNTTGPALFFVSDFFNFHFLGSAEKSPEVKILDRYRPTPSANTGEDGVGDQSYQGFDCFVDVVLNRFDERLINFASASPRWNLFRNFIDPLPAMPAPPVQAVLPSQPLAAPSPTANRFDGVEDRLDFGSLADSQTAGYPLVMFFPKFRADYSNVGLPPGYTFFSTRIQTAVDERTDFSPHAKRFIFQAIPHRVEFPNESIFKTWNRKKQSVYPETLLNLSNYYLDPSYTAVQATNGIIRGGRVTFVRGIPKGLPIPA